MSLANKALGSFLWAFLERFGVQMLQMVVFIVLARILTPEAFGLIGMLTVFIAVSQAITDSGFGQALIQKKDTDEIDYSSVFYINMVISGLVYIALFFSAPYIADFYNEPQLVMLLKVLGLRFIISAFSMVQIAKLTKEVRFKELMISKLPSSFLGGLAGIVAAYMNYGVWSLVIQQLVDITAYSLQIWIHAKWKPLFVFNWSRIKSLFDFGGKMMIEGILSTVYQNLYELMIGRYFSTAQVGFYTQANKLKQLPIQNISNALNRVTFPILVGIQDDDVRLKNAYKKMVRQVFLVITPLMVAAIVLAPYLFRVLLTEKWMPAVPYFQWLCVSGIFYPVQAYNLNILKVKGRSDLFLKLGFLKKGISILGIVILVQYSVLALVIFRAFNSVLAYYINSYYSGRFINYGMLEQIKDIWKFLAASTFAGAVIWALTQYLSLGDVPTLLLGGVGGLIIYVAIIYKFEYPIIEYTKKMFLRFKGG
tara:strand:- start:4610 stop:6049 length:1440 start_codon:yes stop_codon:yes gene_type:complete